MVQPTGLGQLPLQPLDELGHHGVRDPGAGLLGQVDGPAQLLYGPHVTSARLALLLQLQTHKREEHDPHRQRNQGAPPLRRDAM